MTDGGGGVVGPVAVGAGAVDVDAGAGGSVVEVGSGAGAGSEAVEQPVTRPRPIARTAKPEREIVKQPIRAVGNLTVTQA